MATNPLKPAVMTWARLLSSPLAAAELLGLDFDAPDGVLIPGLLTEG